MALVHTYGSRVLIFYVKLKNTEWFSNTFLIAFLLECVFINLKKIMPNFIKSVIGE